MNNVTIPLRWSLSSIAREFSHDRKTVARKLRKAAQFPDARNRYTTQQVCAALFDELHLRRVAFLAEEAKGAQLKTEAKARGLISVSDAQRVAKAAARAIRTRVAAVNFLPNERIELLKAIDALGTISFHDAKRLADEAEADAMPDARNNADGRLFGESERNGR